MSWTSNRLVSLPRLQAAIGRLAPKLARAKGLFEAVEQPSRQFVFQFAGGCATLAPAGTPAPGLPRARIVFVAEIGALSSAEVGSMMDEVPSQVRTEVNWSSSSNAVCPPGGNCGSRS